MVHSCGKCPSTSCDYPEVPGLPQCHNYGSPMACVSVQLHCFVHSLSLLLKSSPLYLNQHWPCTVGRVTLVLTILEDVGDLHGSRGPGAYTCSWPNREHMYSKYRLHGTACPISLFNVVLHGREGSDITPTNHKHGLHSNLHFSIHTSTIKVKDCVFTQHPNKSALLFSAFLLILPLSTQSYSFRVLLNSMSTLSSK